MALKTFVKISNVTNLSDARYCAGMGVDLIGFNIDPTDENYIAPEKSIEIANWLAGVEFVGEYHGDNVEVVKAALETYPLHYVEYSHPELADQVSSLGLPAIFKTDWPGERGIEEWIDILRYCKDKAEYMLVDGIEQYDENTVDRLRKISQTFPVLLGGNLQPDSVVSLMEKTQCKGIALKGSEEIKPGFKDYDELAEILEILEEEY